ncbi:hypothetical protein ACHAWF_009563 [Thalassiosira exigua]
MAMEPSAAPPAPPRGGLGGGGVGGAGGFGSARGAGAGGGGASGRAASGAGAGGGGGGGVVLRPVLFVVDATRPPTVPGRFSSPPAGGRRGSEDDEPFDVRRTSTSPASTAEGGGEEDAFESFAAALRGRPPPGQGGGGDEDASLAASYASSAAAPFAPGSPTNEEGSEGGAASASPSQSQTTTTTGGRISTPFSRLRKRWAAPSPGAEGGGAEGADEVGRDADAVRDALAHDMEDDPDEDPDRHGGGGAGGGAPSSASSLGDNVSAALGSYARDNPPVRYASRRARIVTVSRRHAFPPSRAPRGKLDPATPHAMLGEAPSLHGTGGSWIGSYDVSAEGILPTGWLEKHARALPSALAAVTSWKIDDERSRREGIRDAAALVDDLRSTLAEKRATPIHLVCLIREDEEGSAAGESTKGTGGGGGGARGRIGGPRDLSALRERICQETTLPQSQVFLLKYPADLRPDDFEAGILRSPYRSTDGVARSPRPLSPSEVASRTSVSPSLRRLDRALRDASARYYARLAEHHERKLGLWRNRYHNTNASFEVNALLAAMRCARYALKAGTMRELQARTGAGGGGGGRRWTDRASDAMRHYDEAYRWTADLHRRAAVWRGLATASTVGSAPSGGAGGAGGALSPGPVTPGAPAGGSYDVGSPTLIETPGGGMGMELALPGGGGVGGPGPPLPPPPPPSFSGTMMASPPPPMRRAQPSPALTSRKGYGLPENVAFFASLWAQSRAVASLLNARLLRAASPDDPGGAAAEGQWGRHRLAFLSDPLAAAGAAGGGGASSSPGGAFDDGDDFFGPAWRRASYAAEEAATYACVAEGRWRRRRSRALEDDAASEVGSSAKKAMSRSFHQPSAPWRAHGEFAEAVLTLRRAVDARREAGGHGLRSVRPAAHAGRRYVGSLGGGDGGRDALRREFERERERDHRAEALDCALRAIDLLDENAALFFDGAAGGSGGGAIGAGDPAAARLRYLAGRLLLGRGAPEEARGHLEAAAASTTSWPSLHLAVRRAHLACEARIASRGGRVSPGYDAARTGMLLRPETCRLLSPREREGAVAGAWGRDPAAPPKEVAWNHDDASSASLPPFEFAVSFVKSTHASSGDAATACVSLRSRLGFPVRVESLRILTTAGGDHDVPDLARRVVRESALRSWLREGGKSQHAPADRRRARTADGGVDFDPDELAFFAAEIPLPSDPSEIALGGSSYDTSKYVPKNARLCNMGLSHAAGNVCESRFRDGDPGQKIGINGKPIALDGVPEASSRFLGGIPLTCKGVVLTLKPPRGGGGDSPSSSSSSSLRLRIERPRLVSPLLRTGTQGLAMEECNFAAHAWSRPDCHPWSLGPRVLRVLGPRPRMTVTNLTEAATGGRAVEGTVNRIALRLAAGDDEECWDVRVRLRCESAIRLPTDGPTPDDEGMAAAVVEPGRTPTFVRRSSDPAARIVAEGGVALPPGWEPRNDAVGMNESHDASTAVCTHLGAGNSLILPLDVFRPLDPSSPSQQEGDAGICSTTYEAIVTYRQVRTGKGRTKQCERGDEVTVVHCWSLTWVLPFAADFSLTNGPGKPYPGGIQHASNMVTRSLQEPLSLSGKELIAADGEYVLMRCSLEAMGFGSNVAASIVRVTNETEVDPSRKVLYSSDSRLFMNQVRQGSKLSLSYSVLARRDVESGNGGEANSLGIISVDWKPSHLPLPDMALTDIADGILDDFGATHGPLCLPDLTPMVFYGPQCQVLTAPFRAKLLKCPSTPKVGTPFCVSYQVTNRTAKSQTLILELNDAPNDRSASEPHLLGAGVVKKEMQMAPFEEKTFSFTFLSMAAGKVLRPPLTVSSGRHQTWVINETLMSTRHLFVMP